MGRTVQAVGGAETHKASRVAMRGFRGRPRPTGVTQLRLCASQSTLKSARVNAPGDLACVVSGRARPSALKWLSIRSKMSASAPPFTDPVRNSLSASNPLSAETPHVFPVNPPSHRSLSVAQFLHNLHDQRQAPRRLRWLSHPPKQRRKISVFSYTPNSSRSVHIWERRRALSVLSLPVLLGMALFAPT